MNKQTNRSRFVEVAFINENKLAIMDIFVSVNVFIRMRLISAFWNMKSLISI